MDYSHVPRRTKTYYYIEEAGNESLIQCRVLCKLNRFDNKALSHSLKIKVQFTMFHYSVS